MTYLLLGTMIPEIFHMLYIVTYDDELIEGVQVCRSE